MELTQYKYYKSEKAKDIFLGSPKIRDFIANFIAANNLQVGRISYLLKIPSGVLSNYISNGYDPIAKNKDLQMTHYHLERLLNTFGVTVTINLKQGPPTKKFETMRNQKYCDGNKKIRDERELTQGFIDSYQQL